MFIAHDYELKREQYRDLLREAEKERLIKLLAGGSNRPEEKENLENLFAGMAGAAKRSVLIAKLRNAG
ncbi:MAG: hypothetical protein JW953_04150 [Anaerolineae bacterium]|nr:hypothetical protein [Anaerolineae bacterium]